MASEAPAHSFLLPRLTALVDEAVANGIARDVAVAVLIDLITAPPFNTSSIDPSANDAPQPDYDRSPDDPVLVARLEALREAGANPFTEWQVPNAVIALKQGAGRLIRDVHDRGVLMLCDPRLGSRGYGKLFLASLPPLPRTRDFAEVERFFAPPAPEAAPRRSIGQCGGAE